MDKIQFINKKEEWLQQVSIVQNQINSNKLYMYIPYKLIKFSQVMSYIITSSTSVHLYIQKKQINTDKQCSL